MLAVHKTGIINKNLDSSATWKFWILPSFSLPPTPFCLSLSSCVNFAIWILPLPFLSFTSLVLFFIFFFFFSFPFPWQDLIQWTLRLSLAKLLLISGHTGLGPFLNLIISIPLLDYLAVTYSVSPPRLLSGLPALHFFCAHPPFLSQGYRLTLPASLCTTQGVKSLIKSARFFSSYYQDYAIFYPLIANIMCQELSELCRSNAVKSWIISDLKQR